MVLAVGSEFVAVPVAVVVHWDDMLALVADAADMDESLFLGKLVAIAMRVGKLVVVVAVDGALGCTLLAAAVDHWVAAGAIVAVAAAAEVVVAAGSIWNVHS